MLKTIKSYLSWPYVQPTYDGEDCGCDDEEWPFDEMGGASATKGAPLIGWKMMVYDNIDNDDDYNYYDDDDDDNDHQCNGKPAAVSSSTPAIISPFLAAAFPVTWDHRLKIMMKIR